MFLCPSCHDESCPRHWIENLFASSFGRCEGCGKAATCADCQGYKLDMPVTDERPEPKMAWKCRTCNQLLNASYNRDGTPSDFRHAREHDIGHKASPIPVVEDARPATLVCDFCSTPDPAWLYPCVMLNQAGPDGSVLTGEMVATRGNEAKLLSFMETNPDFYACQGCHELIEAGEQVKLAIRSVELFQAGRTTKIGDEYILNLVTQVHSRFWQTRNGPAQPVTVPQEDT